MSYPAVFELIGIAGAVVGTIALIPYYSALLKGKAKPNSAAFLIFGILASISFFGQLAAGADASLWFAFVLMVNPFIIFALSLKTGLKTFAFKDKLSLMLAVLILVVWIFSRSAAIALVLVVLVNTIGKYLVAEKAYHYPHGDVAIAWVLSALASILAAISVGRFDWLLLLAPVQNAITVSVIAFIIIYRKRVVPIAD